MLGAMPQKNFSPSPLSARVFQLETKQREISSTSLTESIIERDATNSGYIKANFIPVSPP